MKTKLNKNVLMFIHSEHGLNGLYAYLRKHGIKFDKSIIEFGLNSSKKANEAKENWLSETTDKNTFRFHYYSVSVKARKTGFNYNKIRGIEITF